MRVVRRETTCMFCGQPVTEDGMDPCAIAVTSQWGNPDGEQPEQRFWAHAQCLRERLHEDLVEDAYVLDPETVAPDPDGTDDLAPITMTWAAVSPWLRDLPVDASFLAEDIAWSPVFTPQSFHAGRREVEQYWGPGATVTWLGGPAVPPLEAWPRRADGAPLAHVMSVVLADLEWDEDARRAWPEHRGGLPEDGVLEVFHDLETYGFGSGDRDVGAWLVRWVAEPDTSGLVDPPADLTTPSDACQAGMFLPGWSTRSPMDVAYGADGRFEAAQLVTAEFQRAWAFQRAGHAHGGPEVPVTHVYGHSQEGTAEALRVLRSVLPVEDGDEHRLVLDIEGWTTLDGWFGDGGTLEVWMRASDLGQRRFDRAWCLIRQG